MRGNRLLGWAVGCAALLGATLANAEAPLPTAPASDAGLAHAPTYWVMMVTGEKNGAPLMSTTTPATLGGRVKDTGPLTCTYSPTRHESDVNFGLEQLELTCAVGDAEVFLDLRCNFR